MNLSQFDEALDRYGSDLSLWPSPQRQIALDLLAHSAEARTELDHAAQVERFVRANDPALGMDAHCVLRVTNAVMAALPAHPRTTTLWQRLASRLGLGGFAMEWLPRFAVSTAAAAVLGIVAGHNLLTPTYTQGSPAELLAMSSSYLPLDAQ